MKNLTKKQMLKGKISMYFSLFLGAAFFQANAQTVIQVNSNAEHRKDISPLIYGLNPYHYDANTQGMALHDADINVTALRWGGDAVSSYNWEVNRSTHNNTWENYCGDIGDFPWLNGDSYFNNYNGSFVHWASGATSGSLNTPGGGKIKLVQDANTLGAYPLMQVSALNNVASANPDCLADMNEGDRFKSLVIEKPGGNLSLIPDLNDEFVYADEEVNYLINTVGNSQTENGIKGWCLENEPGLWRYTHPYAKPVSPTLGEILTTNINLAKRIKALDPGAETFGLGAYGFMEFVNGVQDYPATDYNDYMNIPGYNDAEYKSMRWLAAYLYYMEQASDMHGSRLLDVLDLHFYNNGNNIRQDSRSFWDPTYIENSWITSYIAGNWEPGGGQPYDFSNTVHKLIDDFYPDTKLSVSEWGLFNSSPNTAIYVADMLGAFGAKDVYLATYFGRLTGHLAGAFRIYTNYDGNDGTFGNTGVSSTSSNNSLVTAYASLENNSEGIMHLVLINRSEAQQNITVSIDTEAADYQSASVYAMLPANNGTIVSQPSIENIQDNTVTYTLAPSGIYHLVLEDEDLMNVTDIVSESSFYPNPAKDVFYISGISEDSTVKIIDINGKLIREITGVSDNEAIPTNGLTNGVYLIQIQNQGKSTTKKLIINK